MRVACFLNTVVNIAVVHSCSISSIIIYESMNFSNMKRHWNQWCQQKNFQRRPTEKRPKIAKGPKNSTIKPLPGRRGGATEKRPKNSTIKPL